MTAPHNSQPECERCDDTGSVCMNCDQSIVDCECGEDAMPCLCEKCFPLEDQP